MSLQTQQRIETLIAPQEEPLTLEDVKLFLRVDHTDEDALITSMIQAARQQAERFMRISLVTQTLRLTLKGASAHADIALSRGPVQAISAVRVRHDNDEVTVLDSSQYQLSADRRSLSLLTVSPAGTMEIDYVVGYGDAVNVPESIKQGMRLHIAQIYDMRGGEQNATGMPLSVAGFYSMFREIRL